MIELWRAYKHIVTALVLIAIPTLIFSWPGEANDGTVTNRPLAWSQFASYSTLASIGDTFSGWFRTDRDAEVESMREEIAAMREERRRLIGLLQENARLRKLVGFKEAHPEYKLLPARVVSRDVTPFFNVARIKILVGDDVEVGAPVIGADGVVGIVSARTGSYATVQLMTDVRSRIDAVSQRNRTRAIVSGFSKNDRLGAELVYLSANDEIRVGDVMVTSGMAQKFPKELALGRVVEVELSNEPGQEIRATLEPTTDFGRLDEVFVIVGTL